MFILLQMLRMNFIADDIEIERERQALQYRFD